MKVITLKQLEDDFDNIMDDVIDNQQYYRVQMEDTDVMIVPYKDYEVLKDTYQEWVEDPQIDAFPLPVQYVGEAEPEKI